MFQVGGQTDGRTDMTKLIVAFRIFAKMPKIQTHTHTHNIPIRGYGFICLNFSYIVIYQPQLLFLIVTIICTALCYFCPMKERTRSFLPFVFSNNLY